MEGVTVARREYGTSQGGGIGCSVKGNGCGSNTPWVRKGSCDAVLAVATVVSGLISTLWVGTVVLGVTVGPVEVINGAEEVSEVTVAVVGPSEGGIEAEGAVEPALVVSGITVACFVVSEEVEPVEDVPNVPVVAVDPEVTVEVAPRPSKTPRVRKGSVVGRDGRVVISIASVEVPGVTVGVEGTVATSTVF